MVSVEAVGKCGCYEADAVLIPYVAQCTDFGQQAMWVAQQPGFHLSISKAIGKGDFLMNLHQGNS